jgi:TatD DNase family protein
MFTDSHTHLYLDAFDADRDLMIQRALHAGVTCMLLPNIDRASMEPLFCLVDKYPDHCFPMMGLHPTSVKENYTDELSSIEVALKRKDIIAIGETGIDLYWDKTFLKAQKEVFAAQIRWAMELDLPLVIHARDSFPEIFGVLDTTGGPGLRGVFHSFTGGKDELERALSYNFMIGINGIVTFKNSHLEAIAREIPLDRLLLETDAPFLSPVPHRGQRNESSYLIDIAVKVSEIYNLTTEEIARITSSNAQELFRLKPQNEI